MRPLVLLRRADLYLAGLIFLLSSSGVALTYARVEEDRERATLLNREITLGKSHQAVMKDGICIGTVETRFIKEEDVYHLDADIAISASTPAQGKFPVSAEFESSFNLFGQLVGAFIEFHALDSMFRLGFLEIDPIQVKLRAHAPSFSMERNFQMPGPIMLREKSKERFILEYPPLSGSAQNSLRPIIDLMLGDIQSGITINSDVENACPKGPSGILDLAPLGETLRRKVEGARTLLPSGLLEGFSPP